MVDFVEPDLKVRVESARFRAEEGNMFLQTSCGLALALAMSLCGSPRQPAQNDGPFSRVGSSHKSAREASNAAGGLPVPNCPGVKSYNVDRDVVYGHLDDGLLIVGPRDGYTIPPVPLPGVNTAKLKIQGNPAFGYDQSMNPTPAPGSGQVYKAYVTWTTATTRLQLGTNTPVTLDGLRLLAELCRL